MSKSAGVYFHPPSSSTVDAIQAQAPKIENSRSSPGSEFQDLTLLLAQKIRTRANSLPHAEEFTLLQKAAVEEEIASRLNAAPRRARKF